MASAARPHRQIVAAGVMEFVEMGRRMAKKIQNRVLARCWFCGGFYSSGNGPCDRKWFLL